MNERMPEHMRGPCHSCGLTKDPAQMMVAVQISHEMRDWSGRSRRNSVVLALDRFQLARQLPGNATETCTSVLMVLTVN